MFNQDLRTSRNSQVSLAKRYFTELQENAGEIYDSVEDFAKTFLYDVVQRAENIPECNHQNDQVIKYVNVIEKDASQKSDDYVLEIRNETKNDVIKAADDNQNYIEKTKSGHLNFNRLENRLLLDERERNNKNLEKAKNDYLNYNKLKEERERKNKNHAFNFYENVKKQALEKWDMNKQQATEYETSQRALAIKLETNKQQAAKYEQSTTQGALAKKMETNKQQAAEYVQLSSQRALSKYSKNCSLVNHHYADLYNSALKNISESSVRPEILEPRNDNNKDHLRFSKESIKQVSFKLEEGIEQIDKIVKEKHHNVSNEFNTYIRLSYDMEKLSLEQKKLRDSIDLNKDYEITNKIKNYTLDLDDLQNKMDDHKRLKNDAEKEIEALIQLKVQRTTEFDEL